MQKKYLSIGVDIGGTNTAFGFVDSSNNCVFENSFATEAEKGVDNFLERLYNKINLYLERYKDNYIIEGMGISAPGVNYLTGVIESAANLNWGRVNLSDKIKNYFEIPVVFLNDANSAALGEQEFGIANGMKNFIVITLGTGLGSGIVVNGQLLYGQDGLAGEVGHSIIELNGRKCHCGKRGCLETYISATGLKRTVFELLCDSNDESELRNLDYNSITGKIISDLAKKSDPVALKAFDYTAEILGRALSNMVTYFNPEAIILFGGLTEAGELLMTPVNRYFEKYLLDMYKGKVKILKSALQNGKAAVLGACSFVRQEIYRNKVA